MFKKIISILLVSALLFCLASCKSTKGETLTIAYQGGIGYAPVHIIETNKLIQKYYEKDIDIQFKKLDSGASINEGIIGGTVQVGCMGISPAISAISAGVPCKIFTGLCSQAHGLMTNDISIESLKDIKPTDKIALVSTGSIQHILLAMAAEKELGDAHALDNHIQSMSHSEGMAALQSGTVKLHLTSSPFIIQEKESGQYSELKSITQIWDIRNTFLVATVATTLQTDNPELFNAIKSAFNDAINFINNDIDKTIEIECKYLELDKKTVERYINDEYCKFFPELKGADKMLEFMLRAGFLSNPVNLEDLMFSFVKMK